MVRDNTAEYGDREDEHKDRQIQDGYLAVSSQAALNHGGNDQAVTRDLSESQKELVSDVVASNMQQRRVSILVLIQKCVLTKLAMIKEKQSSMAYEDNINKLTEE